MSSLSNCYYVLWNWVFSTLNWSRSYSLIPGNTSAHFLIQDVFQFSLVQLLSRVQLFVTPWTAAHQASLSNTNSWSCSNSCPLSRWCHPTISSSVVPFSSHLQSFPASGSFPVSQFFASGGQSVGASASAAVLPMNIQDWFPLGLTGMNSLQSRGLLKVFSNTTAQKPQFFRANFPLGFPDSSVGKKSSCNSGDPGSIPGSGRSAGEGLGYRFQYSWASFVAQLVKNLPVMWETWV